MKYNILSVVFLLVTITIFLLVFAPMVDHIFYVDHKLEELTDFEIFLTTLVHILLTGFFIYMIHYYIVKKYFEIFKIGNLYKVIIDAVIAITLVGLQRNLVFKLRYLSNKHPIRSALVIS